MSCKVKINIKKDKMQEQVKTKPTYKVIAVDFDGCLCEDKYPSIGKPNNEVISSLMLESLHGAKIILWTCREGKLLDDAVKAAEDWGIKFDAINDNVEELKQYYGNNPRKVGADEYWDDKSIRKRYLDKK